MISEMNHVMTDNRGSNLPPGQGAAAGKSSGGLSVWFVCLVCLPPLLWTVFVSVVILSKGTPGFRIENGLDCFVVSSVDLDLNPVQEGDRIVRLGRLDYHQVLGYLFLPRPAGPDDDSITVVHDGRRMQLEPSYAPLGLFRYLEAAGFHLVLIGALIFLGLLAVSRAAPHQPARLFAVTLAFFSLTISAEFPLHFSLFDPAVQSSAFALMVSANWLAFSTWTHFVLRFPVERRLVDGRPLLLAAIYSVPPVVAIGGALLIAGNSPAFFGWLQRLRYWSVPLIIAGTWLKHLRDYRLVSSPLVKNQLRLLLAAGLTGITPYFLLYMLPNLIIGYPLIPFRLVIIFGTLIPLAFFVAIVRYRLLDVNSLISGGLTYVILVAGLAVSYPWFIAFLKRCLWQRDILSEQIFLVYIVTVAVLFNPLKDRLRQTIDRAFFREKIDHRALLYDFSRRVSAAIRMKDLVALIVERLPAEFRLRRACLMILEGRQSRLYPEWLRFGKHPWGQSAVVETLRKGQGYLICQDDYRDPVLREEIQEITGAGFCVVFGLSSGANFLGLLFLGDRMSGFFYSAAEIKIFSTLANQVAVALENALMYESLERSKNELQQMFDRVVRTEKLAVIGEMTAVLAHEIKNPLGVIRSSAQHMAAMSCDGKTRAELLEFIIDEVDNLNQTINNLLGLARYKPPRFEALNLDRHLASVLETWKKHAAHNEKVAIVFAKQGAGRHIYADQKQLAQVFFNLIQNCEDAMPEGGTIVVETRQEVGNDGAVILFSDTGTGLPAEAAEHVFDKFFTTKEKGLGLGLSICRQIINAHSGRIDIEDNGGRGTTVRIWLPKLPHAALATLHTKAGDDHG